MSEQQQQTLSDIFDEFDDMFEKKGKKKTKKSEPVFTKTITSVTQQEIEQSNEIRFAGGGFVCYGDSYKDILRTLCGAETIYLDLETGSYNSKIASFDPWKNCWPIGIAICTSDGSLNNIKDGPAYYIPINQNNENDVYDVIWSILHHPNCKRWINHNIKYDYLVLHNSAKMEVPYSVQLIDTVTLSKLIDSDRFRYGLDQLSKDWLEEDISEYEDKFKPYLYRNKDYSVIPIDIIAPYACQDVITNRKLYKYICDKLPEECYYVRDMEIELTRVLIDIECNGMRIDPEHLQITEINNYKKLIEIEEELEKITGRIFRPHTNADCFDIICNFYGLPVLKWTNGDINEADESNESNEVDEDNEGDENGKSNNSTGNASFDKHALVAYLSHPTVLTNPDIKKTIELISEYRKVNTFNNLFVKKYRELATGPEGNLLHPSYNQCVRSGRLSCKQPNAQQLDENAKELILPYKDEIFVSYDFSQIEYRIIAHYIENPLLLDKYNNDPNVDFHEFVAEMIKLETRLEGMTRKGGKTLNFGLGFNMGKKKLLKSLRGVKDLMESLSKELDEAGVPENEKEIVFARESEKRAEAVFNAYHRTFPEMKRTSRQAQAVCEDRGYIRNLYNRRRHLQNKFAYKAFNTINQASAADLMKSKMVEIGKYIRSSSKIKIVADVHDEILFSMSKQLAEDPRITHTIAYILEHPILPNNLDGTEKKLLVPIKVSMGIGNTWKEASKSARVLDYDKAISIDEFKRLIDGSI